MNTSHRIAAMHRPASAVLPSRSARIVPAAALLLLGALAALPGGPAGAIVHDRLPGDDLGGSTTLPVPSAIGEDGAAPVFGTAPSPGTGAVPTAATLVPAPAG